MQGEIEICKRCGRKLKTVKSIELKFGPVCWKKHQRELAEEEFLRNQMTIDEVV